MLVYRRSLTGEVISFVHNKGCIGFCVRNIKLAVDQPPLELVEIFATIFCCLKDSSDFSQVSVRGLISSPFCTDCGVLSECPHLVIEVLRMM